MKMNVADAPSTGQPVPGSPEATTIAKIVGAGVTGVLSYVAAILTTVVEAGFWQYVWLGICVALFVCAMSLVILASRDGLRLDHTGLSFERRGISAADRKVRIGEDQYEEENASPSGRN
jgi:hypothetical protein